MLRQPILMFEQWYLCEHWGKLSLQLYRGIWWTALWNW